MNRDVPPTPDTDSIHASAERFSAAWDAGKPPDIGAYADGDDATRRLMVLELVHIDMERRLRTKEGIRLEYYLRKFPELTNSPDDLADLAAAEFLHLTRQGRVVAVADYLRRFPSCAAELEKRLGARVGSETIASQGISDFPVTAETMAVPPGGLPFTETTPISGSGPRTVAALMEVLLRTQILKQAQLARVVNELQHRFIQPTDLLRQLVTWEWLTKFQMELILSGRERDLIIGPYIVFDLLGAGGMGQVFKARHRLMNRLAAIKVIRQDSKSSEESTVRFLREVEAAASLAHPNIVAAYDASIHEDRLYLAMEYVPGVDLARVLHAQGMLPVMLAADYARQVAIGLQHAHEKGMVHRDIKPSNLLLLDADASVPGGRGLVKILDMGLARLTLNPSDEGAALTQTGTVMGTPDYIAPEQSIDSRQADIRSDIYSLGCTLYHLLTGKPPFPRDTFMKKILAHQGDEPIPIESVRPEVPAELAAVVRKMMAKKPEDRYATPSAAAAALVPFCGLGQVAAPLAVSAEIPVARLADAPPTSPIGTLPTLMIRLTALAQTGIELSRKLPTDRRWFWPTVGGVAGALILLMLLLCFWPSGHPLDRMRADRIPAELHGKYLPDEVVAILGDARTQHPKDITAICIRPDGGAIATAGGGEIHVSDSKTLKSTAVIKYEGHLYSIAYSLDGKKLIGTNGNQIIRWDLASKKKDWIEDTAKILVTGLLVASDGKIITSGPETRPIVRDANGKPRLSLEAEIADSRHVVFSPDRSRLAYLGRDNRVRVVDAETYKQRASWQAQVGATTLAYSRDGRKLALAYPRSIALYGEEDGVLLRSITVPDAIYQLCFLPGDRRIISTVAYAMYVWSTTTGDQESKSVSIWDNASSNPVLFPDGATLALVDRKNVRLWDTATMTERLPSANPFAVNVEFSPDGRQLLMGGQDVSCWDLATMKQIYRFNLEKMSAPPMAIAPDGKIAVVRSTASAIFFDPRTGREIERFRSPANNRFAFTPDSRLLLADDSHAAMTIRETNKPALETARWGQSKDASFFWIDVFNDGKRAVSTAAPKGGISIWKIPGGEVIRSLPIDKHNCWNLRLSPDNEFLYASVDAGDLWIYKLAAEKSLPEIRKAHGSTFWAMAISKDGKTLLTSNGSELTQWEVPAGKKVQVWQNLNVNNSTQAITFAPDGRHAAATRTDGRVLILRLKSGR